MFAQFGVYKPPPCECTIVHTHAISVHSHCTPAATGNGVVGTYLSIYLESL